MDLIAELTGHTPLHGEAKDGQQLLIIGEIVIAAKSFGLWGDPTTYQSSDRKLQVRWGGQSVTLVKNDDGTWAAQAFADPIQGKARFLD